MAKKVTRMDCWRTFGLIPSVAMAKKILCSVVGLSAALGVLVAAAGNAAAALPEFGVTSAGETANSVTVQVARGDDGAGTYLCLAVAQPDGLPDGVNVSIPSNPVPVAPNRATDLTITNLQADTDYTVTVTCTSIADLDIGSASVRVQTTSGAGGGIGSGSLDF